MPPITACMYFSGNFPAKPHMPPCKTAEAAEKGNISASFGIEFNKKYKMKTKKLIEAKQ